MVDDDVVLQAGSNGLDVFIGVTTGTATTEFDFFFGGMAGSSGCRRLQQDCQPFEDKHSSLGVLCRRRTTRSPGYDQLSCTARSLVYAQLSCKPWDAKILHVGNP